MSDSQSETFDETRFESDAEQMHVKRFDLVHAFAKMPTQRANTTELRQASDVPRGSLNHHLSRLQEMDIISDTGETEYNGHGGIDPKVWEFTEYGLKLYEWMRENSGNEGSKVPVGSQLSEVDSIRSKMLSLEDEVDEDLEEMYHELDRIDDKVTAILVALDRHGIDLEDEFRTVFEARRSSVEE